MLDTAALLLARCPAATAAESGGGGDHSGGRAYEMLQELPDGCYAATAPALLPRAFELAKQRVVALRAGRDEVAQLERLALESAGVPLETVALQQAGSMVAAFLAAVRLGCGAAVAPAYRSFARFRFVESGGLRRAWAWERQLHRFAAERVAHARVARDVAPWRRVQRSCRCLRTFSARPSAAQQLAAAAGRSCCDSKQR